MWLCELSLLQPIILTSAGHNDSSINCVWQESISESHLSAGNIGSDIIPTVRDPEPQLAVTQHSKHAAHSLNIHGNKVMKWSTLIFFADRNETVMVKNDKITFDGVSPPSASLRPQTGNIWTYQAILYLRCIHWWQSYTLRKASTWFCPALITTAVIFR